MGRFLSTGFILFCFFATISGCGSSSPTPSSKPASDHDISEGRFIDWNLEDWKFQRHLFASAYMFEQNHPRTDFSIYKEATSYDGPVKSVTLEEFKNLDDDFQEARRKVANNPVNEAMVFYRVMLRSWEIWLMSKQVAVADEAFLYENGIISHTLKHLETAVGLDPSNPYTWQHLGFFTGLVGDKNRQFQALNTGLETLADYQSSPSQFSAEKIEELALMNLRMVLDRAWLLRSTGFFDQSRQDVEQAIRMISEDDMRTFDQAREALLLQALVMVDQGEIHEARIKAKKLGNWQLHRNKSSAQSTSFAAPVTRKENLEKIDTDFDRQWVWAMTYLKQEDRQQALGYLNNQKWVTEFPPHLNYRFFQDMGRIQEHFGQWDKAKISYGFAVLNRPFFPFFPMQGATGLSRIFSQTGTGHTYYLGYGNYFISGSYFSFAANRVVALEVASNPEEFDRIGKVALASLSTCIARETRTSAALALRGRVHYRLENFHLAEEDLHRAHEMMIAEDSESSDVVKLLAVLHFNRKDYQGTIDLLTRYNELEPGDGFGWRLSGLALAHQNQFDEALKVLDVALDIDPQSAPGWYNRALVHLHLTNVDLARFDLENAIRLEPGNKEIVRVSTLVSDNPGAKLNLTSGRVELKISESDSLLFARANNPNSANMVTNLRQEDVDRLLENLERGYEEDPSQDRRLALGVTLVQAGRMKEVQELLIAFWPDELSREETLLLLRADRALGQTARAIKLARTLRYEPDPLPDADFWALVAIICLENDAPEYGGPALDMALELDPENVALLRMKYGGG